MLISTVELRQMLGVSSAMAAHSKKILETMQPQLQQQGQSLPPSEIAMASIAANMCILASWAIKAIEAMEKNSGPTSEGQQSESQILTS